MPKIEEISAGDLGWLERMLYRYLVIPRVGTALLDLGEVLAFMNRQSNWGTGRVDTFNAYKTNHRIAPPIRCLKRSCTGRPTCLRFGNKGLRRHAFAFERK